MKWQTQALVLFALVGTFFSGVSYVVAQGLVTGGRDGDFSPDGYGICEFVDVVNNVMEFLIGMLGLLAAIMFFYAGFMMVTSRGSAGQIQQAKGLFSNFLIGAVVMFAAYLIINTILSILLASGSSALGWQSVSCSYAREAGDASSELPEMAYYQGYLTAPDDYVGVYTPVVVGDMPTSGGVSSGSCNAGGLQVGQACYAPNRCQITISSGACTAVSAYESLIQGAAARYGVSADVVRGIMITESGGNPNARSPVGALGLMQLMPGTAASACGVSASQLYDPATNIDCGTRYFAQMVQQFGDMNLAIAAYNAGPGGNAASSDCPGLRRWQCPYNSGGCCTNGTVVGTSCAVNTGYQETRAYVDKVNAAAPRCRG